MVSFGCSLEHSFLSCFCLVLSVLGVLLLDLLHVCCGCLSLGSCRGPQVWRWLFRRVVSPFWNFVRCHCDSLAWRHLAALWRERVLSHRSQDMNSFCADKQDREQTACCQLLPTDSIRSWGTHTLDSVWSKERVISRDKLSSQLCTVPVSQSLRWITVLGAHSFQSWDGA